MTFAAHQKQQGFSLLELLVAFAIMAMSLGLIYKAMGANARNVGDMTLHQQASMLVDSLLNRRDSVTDQGWSESGTHATFAWQINSQLYPSSSNAPAIVPLHEILLTVTWTDGLRQQQLTAQTLLPQRKPLPGEVVR